MNIKIADLMVKNVVCTQPHKSVGHVKDIMKKNHISCVPVVNTHNEPVGVITTNDFKLNVNDNSPASTLLSGHVYCVSAYNDISVAAKMMRKHRFHHLIVTHEKEIVGIISSFDLLKLLDENKFVAKNAPTSKKRVKVNS